MQRIFCLLGCSVLLVSCSQYSAIFPSNPTNTSTQLSIPTETYIATSTPTITPTFTETRTPTVTMTPSETAIPRPVYKEGLADTPEEFTTTTEEGKQLIKQDIIAHPTLQESQPDKYAGISTFSNDTYSGIRLICRMGSSCVWRASVHTVDPVTGLDQYDVFLEVRLPGADHSSVLDLCINGDVDKDVLQRDINQALAYMHEQSGNGKQDTMWIPTKLTNRHNFHSPLIKGLIAGMSDPSERNLDKLQNQKTPLWLKDDMQTG